MTQLRVAVLVIAVAFIAACGPKPPPVPPAPPPTKASLMAEGKDKVKRALGYIEEIEQIRGIAKDEGSPIPVDEPPPLKGKKGAKAAKPTPAPAAPPRPAGMDESTVMELDRLLSRARELKDQLVALREELAEGLEKAAEPIVGPDLAKAKGVLSRMSDKVGEVRDQRTRALELKPKPPEPEKKKDDKAPPVPPKK
jgi:hypothetical protein